MREREGERERERERRRDKPRQRPNYQQDIWQMKQKFQQSQEELKVLLSSMILKNENRKAESKKQ